MTPGPGMGPHRLRVELALKYTNPSQLEIGRSVALEISTLCGEVSILAIYPCSFPGYRSCICVNELLFWEWTLSSPDGGYFMYDLRPMSDQQPDKMAIIPGNLCLYFRPELDRA